MEKSILNVLYLKNKPQINDNNMSNIINTSKSIAIISFIIGTILFVIQLLSNTESKVIFIGFIFLLMAIFINIISLTILIFFVLGSTKYKTSYLKAIGVVLLNIPIALLYFNILIKNL